MIEVWCNVRVSSFQQVGAGALPPSYLTPAIDHVARTMLTTVGLGCPLELGFG